MRSDISVIVIGGLNTDIVALGAKKLLKSGEYTTANQLHIGAGGKSRNIAQMLAVLTGKNKVAMISKTSKDPYGLWKLPVDSLKGAGVNIDNVAVLPFSKTKKFPSIALIPVDTMGRNQIYVLPGIADEFLPQDIDNAHDLFKTVAANNGHLILTLELPYQTALHAVKKAKEFGIKVLFDPGGMNDEQDYNELLKHNIFLIKPNEHEAKILTGITVHNPETAKAAANTLLNKGIKNVFVTTGKQGGYFFSKDTQKHFPIPDVERLEAKDETGCGDQTMAAFAFALSQGNEVLDAAKIAIRAGTLQFYKSGISPVTRRELEG